MFPHQFSVAEKHQLGGIDWDPILSRGGEGPGVAVIKQAAARGELYLNPDPWDDFNRGKLMRTYVNFNRERVKALIDSGAQVSQITVGLTRKMGLKIKPLKRLLKLEGVGGAHVKYMGYVKAYLDIPEIRAFNYPCLFLVL